MPEPELPEPELPEPELPELSEAELSAVEPFMAQFSAGAKAAADQEFNSRPLSHADLVAKAKAQATFWAAQLAEATAADAAADAADAAAAACVVAGPPLRDSSICPQDGDPVNPDEPGYLSERFTAFWSDDPGSDNWIADHPAHPDYITPEEHFDQLVACYLEDGGWQRLPDDSYHNRIRDACRGEQLAQGLIKPTRMDKKKKRGQSSHRQARKPAGGKQARKPAGRSSLLGGGSPTTQVSLETCASEEAEELGEAEAAEAPPGLSASAAPQDWCDPDSSEEELGLDTEYMESYGRVEQRRQHLARDASHDDGRAAA